MKCVFLLVFAALSLASAEALAQEPSAPDPYAVLDHPQGEEPPRRIITLYGTAGFAYRSLYGVPIFGADLEFSFGGRTRVMEIFGSVGGTIGRTEQGLLAGQLRGGPTFLFPVGDRLRLGLEPRFGWLGIRRITKNEMIHDFSMGIHGIATVDLTRSEDYAIFLGGRIGFDWLLGAAPDALVPAGTLMIGARY